MKKNDDVQIPPLTYRQCLIGLAIAGLGAHTDLSSEDIAIVAIKVADEVIRQLEAEQDGNP